MFRDKSAHIDFALEVIATARREQPDLFDAGFGQRVTEMIREAVDCELTFAEDTLSMGVTDYRSPACVQYLQYVADRRLAALHPPPVYGSRNPFAFVELQDVQDKLL